MWTVEYIVERQPRAFILENVPAFVGMHSTEKLVINGDPGRIRPESPYADMLPMLEKHGYAVDYILLPMNVWAQARGTRVFIMGVHRSDTHGGDDASVLVARAKRLAAALHHERAESPPIPRRNCLMSMGGVEWMEFCAAMETQDVSEAEVGPHPFGTPSGGGALVPAVLVEESREWQKQAKGLREQWHRKRPCLQCQVARPWTAATDGFEPRLGGIPGPLAPRKAELLDLALLWGLAQQQATEVTAHTRDLVCQGLLVNVSQNPARRPWSYDLGRLTRTSRYYSFADDRVLSAQELFRIYGWQRANLTGIKFGDAIDMLGDSMALPTLGVAMSALIIAGSRSVFSCWGETHQRGAES